MDAAHGKTVFLEIAPEHLAGLRNRAAIIAQGILAGPLSAGVVDRDAAQLGSIKIHVDKLADFSLAIANEIDARAEQAWKDRLTKTGRQLMEGGKP